MRNEKKRVCTEVALHQNRLNTPVGPENSGIAVVGTNNQLNQSVEIKEEPHIKEEPVGELIDVPASSRNSRHIVLSLGVDQSSDKYDFDDLDFDDVKFEVKEEVDKKKVAESKYTDPGKGTARNQHGPQKLLHQDEDDMLPQESGGHGVAKAKVDGKVGDSKNVSTKKHKCVQCEYSTDRKIHFNIHLLKHTGEKPHGCDFCPKRFTSKQNLRGHMKAHIKEFLFHCPGCLQGFGGKNEEEAHEVKCKTLRYECHLCNESFGSMKGNLMKHMRVHSGDKLFDCNECSKQFARKSHVMQHMKLHGGPRSFRCSRCHLRFVHQDERNAHEEKCKRSVYECYVCGKSIGLNKCNLIDHMRTHSGETPFECQRCLKQFQRKSNLNNHMVSYTKKLPFKCSICRQGFAKQSQCKAHAKNCHRRCYECHLCKKFSGSKKTNIERHMRTHSGDKPFQCELCPNKFTQASSLQKHISRIHNQENR